MPKNYGELRYRLEGPEGYVETGTYRRTEPDLDPAIGEEVYPICEGCGEKADWSNIPDDRLAAGYSGLDWCESCLEEDEKRSDLSHLPK